MGVKKQKKILNGHQTKNLRAKDDPMVGFFLHWGKNKVHQIVMFAKQKSCTIIDVEKGFFFYRCQMPQKKFISFLILNIYYF